LIKKDFLIYFIIKTIKDLREVKIKPSSKSYSTIPNEKRNNVTNIYECLNICILENPFAKACFYNDKEGICLTLLGNDYILSSNTNSSNQSIHLK
jgi:hypothetical protein